MEQKIRQFASDNYSGICPEAMEYLNKANMGHDIPYGEDQWTAQACNMFRDLFETECEVFFVFNGTAANSLALASMCHSYHSVICQETGHIETDECGAPEFFSNGAKLLTCKGADGKLDPAGIERLVTLRTDIHYPKPRVVSLTQSTELGTVYTPSELLQVYKVAKKYDLKIHMDGARFANAVAALGLTPKEITWQCGVDVLCFGGTKNGLPGGEAVVFFSSDQAAEFAFRCKQAGQLASKMRFLTAPWVGILKDDAWLRHAAHANACAKLLEERLRELPEIQIMFPRQANAVFVTIPEQAIEAMHARGWRFYTFIGVGVARLMCSWDTTKSEIDTFVTELQEILNT